MPSGVIFSESFGWAAAGADLYATDIGKWTRKGTNTMGGFGTAYGRVAGVSKGVYFNLDRSNAQVLEKDFAANYGEWTFGFAFRPVLATATFPILSFWESGTEHFRLNFTSAGNFQATRAGTVLGTGTGIYVVGVWYYVWVRVLISDTVGTAKVIVNGVTEVTLTAQDTRNAGTGVLNRLRLGHSASVAGEFYIADLVLLDCAVNAVDKLANDLRVEHCLPDADGFYNTAWPATGAATRREAIDDVPPDSDTTYIEGAAVNDQVSVGLANPIGQSGTIHTVVPWVVAKKTDAGDGTIAAGLRQNATDALGADLPLSTNYQHLFGGARDTAPDASAWDYTKINAAELLIKRQA